MNLDKLPPWLRSAVASLGGLGLFVVAFLDSSVLSIPMINDVLVIHLSMQHPVRMPYYALMATLGSLAGCIWLFYLAKKGGELMFRRRAGARTERIRDWVIRNGFLSVLFPSMMPWPMPFKAFVVAAGVFQVRVPTFVLAVVAGRGFRYLAEGILAVRYGEATARYLFAHKLQFAGIVLAFILLSYLLTRLFFGRSAPQA